MADYQSRLSRAEWRSAVGLVTRSGRQATCSARYAAPAAAWIEDYNHVRLHSALGMAGPVGYERVLAGKDAA